MKRNRFNLLIEPKGSLYRDLIDYAIADCEIALLVVRKSITLESGGKQILSQLEPFVKQKTETSEWPGTKLYNKTAWVFQYDFRPECAKFLKQTTDALYNWIQPQFPEDLCFLRSDGEPWLVSISHERDGFLQLSEDEERRFLVELPIFKTVIAKDLSKAE